jgi:HAD superfamily hydrolase (TIGR01509 family)
VVDTIFFDLGNVLIDINKTRLFGEIVHRLEIPEASVREIAESDLEQDFEKGDFGIDEYILRLRRDYHITAALSADLLIDVWEKAFSPNPRMLELVAMLKRQAQQVILSNTNALHIRAVRRLSPCLDEFDRHVFSYEVGVRKPDPRIFQRALKIAGTTAARSLFIDDLPENVAAASRLGIKSHRFIGVEDVKVFLSGAGFRLD